MDEFTFRASLNPLSQVLRPGELLAPALAFTVFSQFENVEFPVETLRVQAARFFRIELAATVEKNYALEATAVREDAIQLLVAEGGVTTTHFVFGTANDAASIGAAALAEAGVGSGLAMLAARCPTRWLVATDDPRERRALLLAAVLASVALGPILLPQNAGLIGVKGARALLDGDGYYDDRTKPA
jgi:hypothetical protein